MIKIVKVEPRKGAVDVINNANEQFGASIGVRTARNQLREANLLARIQVKKPLIRQG